MPRPLSEDLRKRIVKKREEGYREADISDMLSVSRSSVYRLCQQQRERGHLRTKKMGQPEGARLDPHKELIRGWIQKEPGLTLEELTERLAGQLDVCVHHTTVMRALFKWGYRYKKNAVREGAKPPGRKSGT